MYLAAIMAFLHHLAAFTVVTALGVEVALLKPPLTAVQARRIMAADILFGASATALLVIGLLRVFFFEKGAKYYFSNGFFLAKLSLFVIAFLISIYPTVMFQSWRKPLKSGRAAGTRRAARTRTHVHDVGVDRYRRDPVVRAAHGSRFRIGARTSHVARAGNSTMAPSMFTRNMNVSMMPMSA
jgi:putative membrane protein